MITRPEQLIFVPDAQGHAQVVNKQFIGAGYRVVVETIAGMLMIDAPLTSDFNIGDRGQIQLQQAAWLVKN